MTATTLALTLLVLTAPACSNTTLDLFDPNLGLLAHWALDEATTGSRAVDGSSLGNHGEPSPIPPVPTTSVPPVHFADPYSLSFNGQDQWIDVGDPALLDFGAPITLTAWVRATAYDGYRNIVGHGYRWDPNFDLALRISDGAYQFTHWNSVDHMAAAPIPAVDANTWVHLGGTFDGSTYALYRNGALIATTADTTVPPANIDASWAIGGRAPQPSGSTDYRYLRGDIDDVRIYGRSLSAAELEALYRR